jgi:CheY-like chemotaxis protein
MLIAMHLEQILRDAGITQIVTAGSNAEALERLRDFAPDLAILDVNLGSETSEPLAIKLAAKGVPFLFATGYGDAATIPAAFAKVPVVRKPFEAAAIVAQLQSLHRAGWQRRLRRRGA